MKEICQVIRRGVGLSLQDQGRSGWAKFGVPYAGALDAYSAAQANHLVGNRRSAPVLEILLGGTSLEFMSDSWVAVTGADLGCEIDVWTAILVKAGSILTFRGGATGVAAYLSVVGGFRASIYLGSCASDLRNGIGEILGEGTILSGEAPSLSLSTDRVAKKILEWEEQRNFKHIPELQVLAGPQYQDFSVEDRQSFVEQVWTVSTEMDRTGYRLVGRSVIGAPVIKSEPVLPGSFQVPPDGQPIVTMNDGPTVGGYPKIAILSEESRSWFAQARPGAKVRFAWID